MNRQEAIQAVKTADISKQWWFEDIVDNLDDQFAYGYLTAKIEDLLKDMEDTDEKFRLKILEYVEDDAVFEK